MNQNNNYEQEIDLKDLMFAVLRKWRLILATAVLFAVLLGGFKTAKGLGQMRDETYVSENQKAYEESLEQYEITKGRLEKEIENIQNNIQDQQDYRENSILMNINPYDVYVETASYYVGTDYVILPGMSYQNPNTSASILKGYMSIAQNGEMYNYVLSRMKNSMSLRYLKELVTIEADYDNSMLDIRVIGDTKERASEVMSCIRESIENSRETMTAAIGAHSINAVEESSFVSVDLDLDQKQKEFSATMDQLDTSLEEKTEELKALEEPANTLLNSAVVVKSGVKYGILGGVLGAFLVVFFVCVAFLMSDKLVSARELKRRYGVPVLGVFSRQPKGAFAFIDRFINSLESGKSQEMEEKQLFEVAAANAENHMESVREILLIGTVDEAMLEMVRDGLAGNLRGVSLTVGGDLGRSADAIRKVPGCDGVILVEKRNASGFAAIEQELDVVRSLEKPVIGCMVL